ncbi:MAG: class I tRNA ligase family protein, partial [Candidatus Paceibacterota bacterium]
GLAGSIKNFDEIKSYRKQISQKTEIERTAEDKEKTGVEVKGLIAMNPATGAKIPVWLGDYVLAHYGTGAVMAVPAHDKRDFSFAKKYNLNILPVIRKGDFVRSILMGCDSVLDDDLCKLGIKQPWKKDEDHRYLEIPKDSLSEYEKLIEKNISKEYWNEYITDKAVFLVRHSDGKFERVELNKDTNIHIDDFTARYTNSKPTAANVWTWLAQVPFYKEVLIHEDSGLLMNSGKFNGQSNTHVISKMAEEIGAENKITYKLRDWIFSRQHYWGEPIPLVHCAKCGIVPIPEKELPVVLPNVKNYKPTDSGESPLAGITKWVNTKCPKCKGPAKRETDTMPNWAGSSWYFLRYIDPQNSKKLADPKKLKYWLPIDWYNGGMEHTTLHLLYSRFWHKFLFDIGVVPTSEPYAKRTSHGMVLAQGGEKMSKSRGNVVNPDDIVDLFGADSVRLYEMFMGPFDQAISWDSNSMVGVKRFLEKVWRIQFKVSKKDKNNAPASALSNDAIKKVSGDIESMRFNTAVSKMMIMANELDKQEIVRLNDYNVLLNILAPFAPHITEEIWEKTGSKKSIHLNKWPTSEEVASSQVVNIAVQINGKVRGTVSLPNGMSQDSAMAAVLAEDFVKRWVGKTPVKKFIYIPNRVINIVL